MADETTIAPQGEPQGEPAPKPAETTAPASGTEPTTEPAEPKPVEGEPKPAEAKTPEEKPLHPQTPKWAKDRIDQLTREKHEARREAQAIQAALDAALAARNQPPATTAEPVAPSPDAKPLTQSDIDRRAAEIVRQREFDAACNKVHDAGMAEFKDGFAETMRTLGMLGGIPPTALEAVTDMPDGHKVLHELGKNPEEAQRLFALPPARMIRELTKIEAGIGKPAPKPISEAPAPLKTVDGSARQSEGLSDDLPIDEWIKRRTATERKRA